MQLLDQFQMDHVTKVHLPSYMVLLSNDSKITGNKTSTPAWRDPNTAEMKIV